ncbi:MAG: GAF domain-containing protein [Anaerolineae bacterium]|jgi:GAF domain-containing protein
MAMLGWTRQLFAAPVFEGDEDKTRVGRLLNAVLWAFMGVMLAYGISTLLLPNPRDALAFVATVIALSLIAFLLMRRGHVRLASIVFLSTAWLLLTLVALAFGGMDGVAVFGYIVVVVMAGLLLGGSGGFAFAVLSVVAGLALVWAESNGFLPPPMSPNLPLARWAAMSLYVLMTATLLFIANRNLDEALAEARRYADELEGQQGWLEVMVEERTQHLDVRARYLEATSEVARDAASVLNLEELLPRVVTLLSERFDYYHAGIFLLDPAGEWAVLQAASSEGGQRMLVQGHRLGLGVGIVGHVAQQGQPRIALDVGEDAVYFDNPDLPDTRSEMALPLRARGEMIGVLDVQSVQPGAFGQEDIQVLQTLADQVALAIDNARLLQQAQESLEAERQAYGQLSREAWGDLLSARPELGLLHNKQGATADGEVWHPEMELALRTGKTARGGGDAASLAIPIRAGGQVIGVIDARKPSGSDAWTATDVAMMEALTEQLGVALESARLYEDTQRLAVRDRLVSQVTSRMRESLDVQRVLETAADELYQAFGLNKVVIRMATDEDDAQV